MKKIIFVAISLACLAYTAGAQTMMDALNVCQNNYYGTARTIGLGNAVTAVGGDLGSVGINPAGSAVAGYSQITLTPGITISSTSSAYAPSYADYYGARPSNPLPENQVFGAVSRSTRTRFNLPNVGLMMRFDTGRNYGLRAVTFGVVSNGTSNFTDEAAAGGINSGTSITGAFAAFATTNGNGRGNMMPGNILAVSSPFNTDFYWNYVAAYWGGLINYNRDAETYFGSAETVAFDGGRYDYFVKGELRQRHATQALGSKNDIVFNVGFDINDNVFVGINLGLPAMNYRFNQNFYESAYSDPLTDFVVYPEYIGSDGKYVKEGPNTFEQAKYQYAYNSSATGIYGKIGVIVLPTDNLRVGAAVQTPTAYTVREIWQVHEDCLFGDGTHHNSNSPEGNYRYRLRGPYSINAGLAYTFGSSAMLSVDYEMADFSIMQYRDESGRDDNNFYRVNRLNRLFCGVAHSVRAGVEVKPMPFLALRLGGAFRTDPTCHYKDLSGVDVDAYIYDRYFDQFESGYYQISSRRYFNNDNVWAISGGLGFISAGSFFADLAVRRTSYPATYTEPYAGYIDGPEVTVYSPSIRSMRRLWDVMLTLGWRF